MALFAVPERQQRADDKRIASKVRSSKKATPRVTGGITNKITTINSLVEKNLGKYRDDYITIRDEQTLSDYINTVLTDGVISIDTETSGLDPILDTLAGVCVYSPSNKGAYIPIHHESYITKLPISNQLPADIVSEYLNKVIEANVDIIMFNAKFDIRVLRNQLGLKNIYCTWDCYLAARLLNENEPTNALKKLHQKYVLKGKEDAFTFDELFKGVSFTQVPIDTGYIYAARDAEITYELYLFQKQYLYYEPECTNDDRNGMNGVSWVFFNIEMPCVQVVADMEDAGVLFDMEYAKDLAVEYNMRLTDRTDNFYKVLEPYEDKIAEYRLRNPNNKLDNPINISSTTQIAILLYDIMGLESVDRKSPRGTGEHILVKLNHPVCKAILEYREVQKLLSTYIEKLPQCVSPKDGRIHCSFNQYGADTGRFSSSDPNLQNLPSHAKDIRPMFIASNDVTEVETVDNCFTVEKWCEVECADEWKYADKIIVGDELLLDDGSCVNVCGVNVNQDKVVIDFR